jgi:hypothetical protein
MTPSSNNPALALPSPAPSPHSTIIRMQELYGLLDWADNYLQAMAKQKVSDVKQRILVLPSEVEALCLWQGR